MRPDEQIEFGCDCKNIQWKSYLLSYIKGLSIWVVNENHVEPSLNFKSIVYVNKESDTDRKETVKKAKNKTKNEQLFFYFSSKLSSHLFESGHVSIDGLQYIQQLRQDPANRIVLVPMHRSLMDIGVLNYLNYFEQLDLGVTIGSFGKHAILDKVDKLINTKNPTVDQVSKIISQNQINTIF